MLSPDQRLQLIESLAPPPGHVLDFAVGTSFSLNLDALLTAPAAFAVFRSAADGSNLVPVEIIDSIQRHADRIVMFHQTGQVSVPKTRTLFGLIESMVVPARAPLGGIFHPKVWVLRYRDEAEGHLRYRVLCASRNLTHDASWDTLLRLDSDTHAEHSAALTGLGPFLRALPDMAIQPLDEARRASIATLADELDRVRFAVPAGFDRARFIGMGLADDEPDPLPPDAESMLVISPFLGLGKAQNLARRASRAVLVSRAEEIERLGRGLAGFETVYVLDPDAHPSLADDADRAAETRRPAIDPDCTLSGLHAKLYVFDTGDRTRLFTGSANASAAAFSRNVEAMVELEGRRSEIGVAALLGEQEDDAPSLRGLLYEPSLSDAPPDPMDDPAESLDALRWRIAELALTGDVAPSDDGRYTVHYRSDGPLPPLDDATLKLWPITLGDAHARAVDGNVPIDVGFEVSFEGLSRFVACELSTGDQTTRFVVCAELHGAPVDRRTRLVRVLLKDSARVLRYLLMLLMDAPEERFDAQAVLDALHDENDPASSRRHGAAPLLEALLRTLRRSPARLRDLHAFVESLARDEETASLLPKGFDQVWSPIWALAQEEEGQPR